MFFIRCGFWFSIRNMSFRSRSTKPVAPPRRRSSSLTRNAGTSNGSYQTTSNGRPYSVHGSALSSFPSTSQSYLYGSNQNLRAAGSDYFGNGGSDYRRSSYGASNSSLKFPSSNAYSSPYKDRYSQNYSSNGNGSGSSYTSAYKDRGYYNPYSSYDNGVTTASLSIPMTSSKRDYSRGSLGSGLSGSNTNLMNNGQSINDKVANIGRSQSLREHERKSRSRKCKEAVKAAVPDTTVPYEASGMSSSLSSAQKSLSSLSLHSEGYEVIFNCRRSFFLNQLIWNQFFNILNFKFAVWKRVAIPCRVTCFKCPWWWWIHRLQSSLWGCKVKFNLLTRGKKLIDEFSGPTTSACEDRWKAKNRTWQPPNQHLNDSQQL